MSLISAPAGFSKTTLLSEWANQWHEAGRMKAEPGEIHPSRVAWLLLDRGDNDLLRFLIYLVAALRSVAPQLGASVLAGLQAPQPPPTESILTALRNEITTMAAGPAPEDITALERRPAT